MHTSIRIFLAAMTALSLTVQLTAAQVRLGQQQTGAVDLTSGLPVGVSLSVLADQFVEDSPHVLGESTGMSISLMVGRVPLPPQASMTDVLLPNGEPSAASLLHPDVHNGAQLIYIEQGQVAVEESGNAVEYGAGNNLLIPKGTTFEVVNRSQECASILTVVFYSGAAGPGLTSLVSGPLACGEADILWDMGDAEWPVLPARFFLANVSVSGDAFMHRIMNRGPVLAHVTSGEIYIDSGVGMRVGAGTWMSIHPNAPYSIYTVRNEPATLLMAGIIPAEAPLFATIEETSADISSSNAAQESRAGGVSDDTYTSPRFGFTVSWDETVWTVREDLTSSESGIDYLQLDAATGILGITGVAAYNGDPGTCLASEVAYQSDPTTGTSEWEVDTHVDGGARTGTTANSYWGIYSSVWADPENPSAVPIPIMTYIECVSIGDNSSVVLFIAKAGPEDFREHLRDTDDVIESLELP